MRTFTSIAKLIKEKRNNHPNKISQSDLSDMLGYKNGQFISNVERGLCNVPLRILGKIAEILNIPSDEIKNAMLEDHARTLDNYISESKELSARSDSQSTSNTSLEHNPIIE